jgi:hypothetical protein
MCDEGLLTRVEQLEARRKELDVLITRIKSDLERDAAAYDAHTTTMEPANRVPAAGSTVQCRWPGRFQNSPRRRRPCTRATSPNKTTRAVQRRNTCGAIRSK